MARNYKKELEEAYAYDKENGLSYYGGRASLAQAEYDSVVVEFKNKIFSICVNYGVLPSPTLEWHAVETVMNGKMSMASYLKKLKKDFRDGEDTIHI